MFVKKSFLIAKLILGFSCLLFSPFTTIGQDIESAPTSVSSVEHVPFGVKSPVSQWVMPRKGIRIDRYDSTVELLPLLDLDLDTDLGKFEFLDKELIVKTAEYSRLALPVLAIGTYSVTFTYQTGETKPELRISVPVDSKEMATVAIGYNNGNGIGVDGFQGKSPNQAKRFSVSNWGFKLNHKHKIWIKVEWKKKEKVRLQVHVDNVMAIDRTVRRDAFQSPSPLDQHLNSSVPIILAKTESELRISKIDFRKLTGHTLMTRPLTKTQRKSEGNFGVKFNGKTANSTARNFHFDGKSPLTFESWVIPYNKDHGQLFSAGFKDSHGWLRVRTQDGKWAFNAFEQDSGIRKSAASQEKIKWGKLTHVAAVFDVNRLILFVDGKRVASSKRFNNFNYAPSGCYLRLGSDMKSKGDHFFSGVIDQFRVSKGIRYSEKFDPERTLAADDQTMVLYDFDEAHGNVVRDRSNFGIHSIGQHIEWVRIEQ